MPTTPHAVARLRDERRARCLPPLASRGARIARCPECRVPRAHCLCAWRPRVAARAGVCLLMHDIEALKPSNTGWLVADVVPDTFAFAWTRTEVDPRLLELLGDARWQPYVVFPSEAAAPERIVESLERSEGVKREPPRPLFVLFDATWPEASRMFRKSPYLDHFPVLGVRSEPTGRPPTSRYRLRRAVRPGQLCTAEAAARCLALAGDARAAGALDAWLDVFIARSMAARFNRGPGLEAAEAEVYERLRAFV